jgi:hypothetical protein
MPQLLILPLFSHFGFIVEFIKEFGVREVDPKGCPNFPHPLWTFLIGN